MSDKEMKEFEKEVTGVGIEVPETVLMKTTELAVKAKKINKD